MSVALVFPGQGSQSVGMLGELAGAHPTVQQTFAEASQVLGYDLWALVQNGPDADLNMTERTQPAMLAAGVAVWRVWNEHAGAAPVLMAGHSLGEYTAMVCSGALDFAEGISLVASRGRFMQEAVPAGTGAMAAVMGLDLSTLEKICADAAEDDTVSCANLNAPGQIVIAGHHAAVERAAAAAKAAGAKRALILPVSVPSHCALMKPAAERLRSLLEAARWRAPQVPVLHNADVATHPDTAGIIDALARQLYQPVRWIETVQQLRAQGVTRVIECGPGKVLAGLCKRIEGDLECLPVFDPATLGAAYGGT